MRLCFSAAGLINSAIRPPDVLFGIACGTYQSAQRHRVEGRPHHTQPGSCEAWSRRGLRTTALRTHKPPMAHVGGMHASSSDMDPVVSVQWLADRLSDPTIKVLDGSWYLPNAGRDPAAEFAAARIPGARFFDVDAISDAASPLPHMLPSGAVFAAAVDALGIGPGGAVVVYDGAGVFSAPRVAWTFRTYGHRSVAVLDGGLPAWRAAGLPLDTKEVPEEQLQAGATAARSLPAESRYPAELRAGAVASLDEVRLAVAASSEKGGDAGSADAPLVVDARPEGRFRGTISEPRAGMRSGHMPGAVNVPFDAVLSDGRFKRPSELRELFTAAGVLPQRPLVLSCGTGVTACVVELALQLAHPGVQAAIYDGSWSEWGGRKDTPVVKD